MSGSAVILGASGGIGAALADLIASRNLFQVVHRFARANGDFDYARPNSLDALSATVSTGPPPTLIIIATGVLQEAENGPERALQSLQPGWLARQFQANAIGPAIALKALLPLMPRDGGACVASCRPRSVPSPTIGWAAGMATGRAK